ncbi:MAG TPA: kelch repeat-containing protein, partial [Opitutaceae bacterium]|nr:kelch repeat-containing protein [Opitutaceae bacterium]
MLTPTSILAILPAFGGGELMVVLALVLILFGGDNGTRLGDTWRYDIATNVWTQIGGAGPAPRRWAAMTLHG